MISAMKNMHKNDLEDTRMLTVITWERHKKALALELGKKNRMLYPGYSTCHSGGQLFNLSKT